MNNHCWLEIKSILNKFVYFLYIIKSDFIYKKHKTIEKKKARVALQGTVVPDLYNCSSR